MCRDLIVGVGYNDLSPKFNSSAESQEEQLQRLPTSLFAIGANAANDLGGRGSDTNLKDCSGKQRLDWRPPGLVECALGALGFDYRRTWEAPCAHHALGKAITSIPSFRSTAILSICTGPGRVRNCE